MTDIPALIARVLAPGYCQYDDDLECYSDAQALATALEAAMAENERLREVLREIAGYDLHDYGDSVAHEMRDEARAALEGTK